VLIDVPASGIEDVLSSAARALAPAIGVALEQIEAVLMDSGKTATAAIGAGVAVPHAQLPGLTSSVVALIVTTRPIDLRALDREPVDIFFVVLSRADDPKGHLLLLAHLARLAQSKTLRAALRQASSPAEALELISAAELRTQSAVPVSPVAATQVPSHYLGVISIVGEKALDAVLVSMIDEGFEHASLLEAQSLREAAAREVPLFAGFRDLFGDPGGRRIIMVDIESARTSDLCTMIQRICEETGAEDAEVALLPLDRYWRWERPTVERAQRGGH
jgi:PTS system nitrogen regulatory IIA component